jgi:RNA polymerase sigma factor (sigma-70 family)
VSPLTVRRYRAERLLRDEFEALESQVIAAVRRRLYGAGVELDRCDLEACYAQAWQGLYTAVLAGETIESPGGWLVRVTHRRALDEHRRRVRVHVGLADADAGHGQGGLRLEPDLAAALDDRTKLRRLFEGLRGRLSEREREAAVLCYLQGLSRAEAALRMGLSEARLRKLMDGRGGGRPGVAGKVGALVEAIRDGDWCEEQGSLMRALAFGILDPDGERHRLAVLHRETCPACSAYVVSLRGLAAALPPVLLPWGVGAGALAGLGTGAQVGTGAAGGGGVAGGAGVATGSGGLAVGAGGAAGAGGWVVAGGSVTAKFALGCALALGLGAGCVALGGHGGAADRHQRRPGSAGASVRVPPAERRWSIRTPLGAVTDSRAARLGVAQRSRAGSSTPPSETASREFGPEQPAPRARAGVGTGGEAIASAASSATNGARRPESGAGGGSTSASPTQAAREFGPG